MNSLSAVAIGLSIVLPLTAISAQSDSASTSRNETPKWEFSFGADPTHLDLRTRDPGVDLRMISTLTRNWQSPRSRFSRQLALMIGADAPRGINLGCDGCSSTVTKQYAGLTAGVSADLFHAWRVSPYVHTGAGLYYERMTGGFSVIGSDALIRRAPTQDFTFGINGGIGIKARLRSHELFIDETLHAFDMRSIDHGVYPLSIGIRW